MGGSSPPDTVMPQGYWGGTAESIAGQLDDHQVAPACPAAAAEGMHVPAAVPDGGTVSLMGVYDTGCVASYTHDGVGDGIPQDDMGGQRHDDAPAVLQSWYGGQDVQQPAIHAVVMAVSQVETAPLVEAQGTQLRTGMSCEVEAQCAPLGCQPAVEVSIHATLLCDPAVVPACRVAGLVDVHLSLLSGLLV